MACAIQANRCHSEPSPALLEPQHRLPQLRRLPPRWLRKAVEYQDTPKGDQQCSNCSLFQEPNACTLVDGEISPAGWCKFWVKKIWLSTGDVLQTHIQSDAVPPW